MVDGPKRLERVTAGGRVFVGRAVPYIDSEGWEAESIERVTCASCKYLGEPDPLLDRFDPDEDEDDAPSEHRLCMRIPDAGCGVDPDRQFRHALACVTDGSGYMAKLRVRPTFGCVLWEERDRG